MRVFVAGATGAIGKQLVPRLAAAGHEVHGMTQSNGAFLYARTGGAVKGEEDPLDPSPVREMRAMVAAIRHLEQAVLGAEWTGGDRAALRRVLRAGHIAGAGRGAVGTGPRAQIPAGRRRRRRVVVHPRRRRRRGNSRRGRARRPGAYNIVDDDPAPAVEWLPALARILAAEQPMQAPRLAAGEVGAVLMTELRGASNAKAKRELGWRPAHPTWREGFTAA